MNKVGLSTEFLKVRLRSPLVAASGPATKDAAAIKPLVDAGIGAIITKTILLEPSVNPRPCMYRGDGFFLNTERCSTLSLSTWLIDELPRIAELPVPIIASIGMTSAEAVELARRVVRAGADMVELSIFTPYDDPSPMVRAVQGVKEIVSVPVLVKLSCNVHDLVEFGLALREAGADAFSAIDAIRAGIALDTKTGVPRMLEQGFGRVSGETIKPIALYHVAQLAHYVAIPIVGTGGVACAEDVLEMLYCGAQTVGLCTALIVNGPKVIAEIHRGLEHLLSELGESTLDNVRGKSLALLDFAEDTDERREYEKRLWEGVSRVAIIDQALCICCGTCQDVCPYHAIKRTDEACLVAGERCQGCGLCVSMCPVQAIGYGLETDG